MYADDVGARVREFRDRRHLEIGGDSDRPWEIAISGTAGLSV
jgi:hypothetical protein